MRQLENLLRRVVLLAGDAPISRKVLEGDPELARLFLGNIDRSAKVRRWRGTRFSIERTAPGVIHTDGETHATAATIDVAIQPRSLRVLVPRVGRAVAERVDATAGSFLLQLP